MNSYLVLQFETFKHEMQDGWGLATDGKVLYGSDGSSTLYRIDPQTSKGPSIKHIVRNSFLCVIILSIEIFTSLILYIYLTDFLLLP